MFGVSWNIRCLSRMCCFCCSTALGWDLFIERCSSRRRRIWMRHRRCCALFVILSWANRHRRFLLNWLRRCTILQLAARSSSCLYTFVSAIIPAAGCSTGWISPPPASAFKTVARSPVSSCCCDDLAAPIWLDAAQWLRMPAYVAASLSRGWRKRYRP